MARITIEDCIDKINNRFQLILIAAQRARSLANGNEVTVDRDNDKNPVVALREIAGETIDIKKTEDDLVMGLQKFHEDKLEDDLQKTEDENQDTTNQEIVNDVEEKADSAGMQIYEDKEE